MTYLSIDLGLAVLVLFSRFFLYQLVIVKGRSMLSTLENGQVLWVSMLAYRLRKPRRQDVVICHYPGRRMKNLPFLKENFVKRIVGVPGDIVEMLAGVVYINGQPLDEPYLDPLHTRSRMTRAAVMLGADEYFVMGDNRDNSNDSRRIGPIRRDMIVGRVQRILYPFRKARRIH